MKRAGVSLVLLFVVGCSAKDPDQPPAATTTQVTVPPIIETLLYEPPGNKSQITYGAPNGLGPEMDWKVTLDDGAGAETKISRAGSALLAQKMLGVTLTLQVNDGQDVPDHEQDSYGLLVGATAMVTTTSNARPTFDLDESTGKLVTVTVAELRGLAQSPQDTSLVPVGERAAVLPFIDSAEAQQLLSADPFASGQDITQGPARFARATPATLDLFGPDHPGDSLFSEIITLAPTTGTGVASGTAFSTTGSFTLENSGSEFESEYDYENTTTTSSAMQKQASLTLETDSNCTRGSVDVFFDNVFSSYLTVDHLVDQCRPSQ